MAPETLLGSAGAMAHARCTRDRERESPRRPRARGSDLAPAKLADSTLHAPAAALGLIEGSRTGLPGIARLGGRALADDPSRRRSVAVGGYATTAVLSGLIGAAGATWQVGVLGAGVWTARGLRVPARNVLLADVVPKVAYGRAYGFERAMDNLGAISGPATRDRTRRDRRSPQRSCSRSSPGCSPPSRSSTPSATPQHPNAVSADQSSCACAHFCTASSDD